MTQSLRLQTLALIGQEFLTQALANGGSLDSAMAEMLLSAKPTSGREKAATALTGRIRSDAATMRQGARNASEGAAMATTIKNTALSLGESLSEMQTLLQSVAGGQTNAADAQSAFDSLAANIAASVSGAQYNGISLMDKDGWDDKRLTVSGDTATLPIQMGGSASTFSLRDLSALKDLVGTDLDDLYTQDPTLANLTTKISEHIGTVNTMASGYEALAGSYTSQAKHLESQADILAQTAARAVAGAAESSGSESAVKNILVDILMRDQGKVIDTSS
ncbi:hypothetical protein LJC26_03375 [Desulfovibrio sp. OttesenSCG-928-O18]|nr:hypothetical protein [Desulfovibrio sp. OttesenSCG-928-O18]